MNEIVWPWLQRHVSRRYRECRGLKWRTVPNSYSGVTCCTRLPSMADGFGITSFSSPCERAFTPLAAHLLAWSKTVGRLELEWPDDGVLVWMVWYVRWSTSVVQMPEARKGSGAGFWMMVTVVGGYKPMPSTVPLLPWRHLIDKYSRYLRWSI